MSVTGRDRALLDGHKSPGGRSPREIRDPRLVFPGVDYLLAYWLGRAEGIVGADDDACLRWRSQ